MPPIRTMPSSAPIKPVKTERTHEENQERAYIAASRRSDRSLEARVESARRASEIHKRRTGRSLRVTEQDVVNEEMYEEEDDDLPMQYRRLAAHLHTSSADFNRRLAAYLTSNVAMRNALGQAMTSSQPQSDQQHWDPTSPASQQAQQQWIQSQISKNQQIQQNMQNMQNVQSSMMAPNMTHQSISSYRQTPYPTSQQRPQSISIPNPSPPPSEPHSSLSSPVQYYQNDFQRRMSAPVGQQQLTPPVMPRKIQPAHRSLSDADMSHVKTEDDQASEGLAGAQGAASSSRTMSPLSTALPMEARMFLPRNFDMDSINHFERSGHSQPFYSYNPNGFGDARSTGIYNGMNQTLAPSALDTKVARNNWNEASSDGDALISPFSANFSPFDGGSFDHAYGGEHQKPMGTSIFDNMSDGQVTPSEDFSQFVTWEDVPA